jgi:lysophospholipase L1-like esterase
MPVQDARPPEADDGPDGSVAARRKRSGWLPVGLLGGVLIVCEIVLRILMGNFSVMDLTVSDPGDGRCVGLRPDISVDYSGFLWRIPTVQHDVNNLGYRGPQRPHAKPPGTFRIALLGDSFVYGQGVQSDETISAYLEQEFRSRETSLSVEVLNFGIIGLNLDEYLDQYEHFASRWNPDLVLVFPFTNDLEPPMCRWAGEVRFPMWLARHVYLTRLIVFPAHYYYVTRMRAPDAKHPEDRFRIGMKRLLDAIRERKALPGVVLLGDPVSAEVWRSHEEEPPLDIAKILDRRGSPWLDGRAWLRPEAGKPELPTIPKEGHFTPESHQVIARSIADWLITSGLFPSR